jgi:hypothetical protein
MTIACAPPMPRRDKPKRDDKAVKIDRGLAMKSKLIAETRRITVAEYLSELLRAPIDRDWQKAARQLGTPRAED